MVGRKAFLGSLPCLQLPLTAEPAHCQPAGFQTPPHVPFPCSPSHVGGLDPPPELVSVLSRFPQSLLNQPLHLLLITVPLSPLRGLPPSLELLCAVPPFPSRVQGLDGGCWGTEIPPERAGVKVRGVPSSGAAPGRCPACPGRGRAGEGRALPCPGSERFRGVPAPGLEPLSAITSSPSRPWFIHELCENCQS